jgi:hypothetical protein
MFVKVQFSFPIEVVLKKKKGLNFSLCLKSILIVFTVTDCTDALKKYIYWINYNTYTLLTFVKY